MIGAKPPRAARTATCGATHAPVTLPKSLARRCGGGKRDGSLQSSRSPQSTRGKSLLELTNDCCRWPHGRPGTPTFFFCGALGGDLEHGMPYCARHARRAYLAHEPSCRKRKTDRISASGLRPISSLARARRYAASIVRNPIPRWR